MEGKELLKQGFRWRVEDREDMLLWTDPWLKITYEFKVITKNMFLQHVMRVRDLIDCSTRSWKVGILNNLFLLRDVDENRSAPLRLVPTKCVLIWNYEKFGLFTI